MNLDDIKTARARAFSVAEALPAAHLAALRNRIGRLLETGASFDTAKRELLPLVSRLAETRGELA